MKKLMVYFILGFLISSNLVVAEEAVSNAQPSPSAAVAAPAVSSAAPTPTATVATPAPAKVETPAARSAPAEEAPKPPRVEVKSIEPGNYFTRSVDRLGHGIGNIAYSVLEIPYRIGTELERTNPVSAVTAGSIKGVAWFGLRAVAGAIEVVTFLIPMKPLIRDFDAGWFNI